MANNPNTFLLAGDGRVWLQRDGPNSAYQLLSLHGAGQIQRPRGTPAPYWAPDPANRNNWLIVGETVPPPGLVTTTLDAAYTNVVTLLEELNCPFGLQFRYGKCDRPDIPSAWDKIIEFVNARVGNWTLNPNISRTPDNQAQLVESGDITALAKLTVVKLAVSRISVSELQNAVAVFFDRNANCAGICGPAVDVADKVYVGARAASYGTANLQESTNNGATFAAAASDPFGADLEISSGAKIGGRIIVISDANTPTIAYSDDEGVTWSTATYAGGAVGDLNDLSAVDWAHVYFVGDGGYIYLSADGGGSIAAQNAGAATTSNLNKVRVLQSLTGYAVGDADVILKTTDGAVWAATAAVTGTGSNLISLSVVDEQRAWVGTAGGKMFYTENGGTTWTERTFSGSGTGAVNGIDFVEGSDGRHGFMIHDTAVPVGSIFRTIDGGETWDRQLTVGNGSLGATPTNAGLNAVVAVSVNAAFAVGNVSGGTAVVLAAE